MELKYTSYGHHCLYTLEDAIHWKSGDKDLLRDVDFLGAKLEFERDSLCKVPRPVVELMVHPLRWPSYPGRIDLDAFSLPTNFSKKLSDLVPKSIAQTINDPNGELANMIIM